MLRSARIVLELGILSALILATRCANYQDVFVAGKVYFVDADCYARMTRVRICAEHPGTILRHHDFENFPQGTTPHTTAPLDYVILLLAGLLKPFTSQALDVAGAFVSPLLALALGWFLWWWSRRIKIRFCWAMLLLYALSPIVAHGTELGRPDHQSLLILLLTIAVCAECSLRIAPARGWSLTSGMAWGLALWVSFYEPAILLLILAGFYAICDRRQFTNQSRRMGWIVLAGVLALAFLIERRLPLFPIFGSDPIFKNWSQTIGELMPVGLTDPIWFRWCGWLLIVAPALIWFAYRRNFRDATGRRFLPIVLALLLPCYLLTLWQARWAYFFAILFAIALPMLLDVFKNRGLAWTAFVVSLFPISQAWDAQLWPNEPEITRRAQAGMEEVEWRALAMRIHADERRAFLAPWWLSPSITYWSGQPGVAGSSHESFSGIVDSARFSLTNQPQAAREILQQREVDWVFVYDSDRALHNASAILQASIPLDPLARLLDRTPGRAPEFLHLAAENGFGKLYSVNHFP